MWIVDNLFSLAGRTALVTGASGGIGSVLARALAGAGATVALNGTSRPRLEAVRAEIEKANGRALVFPANLDRVTAVKRLIEKAHDRLGRVDILLNCVGVNRRKPVRQVTEEDFDFITSVNVKSVFFLCQTVFPLMKEQGGGKIINIGSVTSTDGLGGVSVYGATKAAVAQMSRTMALEWARYNIQVNCLAPGFIHTALTAEGLWGDPHRKKWLIERIPMRRPGRPEELAGAALWLASEASSYVTGQVINVDGGYLAGGSWLKEDE